MSDLMKYFNEALSTTTEGGIEYVDLSRANTAHERVIFTERSNGDLFDINGKKIDGMLAESIKGKIELGFYVKKS